MMRHLKILEFSMTKAIRIHRTGGPEVMVLEEILMFYKTMEE